MRMKPLGIGSRTRWQKSAAKIIICYRRADAKLSCWPLCPSRRGQSSSLVTTTKVQSWTMAAMDGWWWDWNLTRSVGEEKCETCRTPFFVSCCLSWGRRRDKKFINYPRRRTSRTAAAAPFGSTCLWPPPCRTMHRLPTVSNFLSIQVWVCGSREGYQHAFWHMPL